MTNWANAGAAGGAFVPASERELWQPLVVPVDGRAGVDFSGRKSLISAFAAPPALLGAGSFTVSLWAFYSDTRGLERDQTILSWGRRPHARAEFCWGSGSKSGAFIGGPKVQFGYGGDEAAATDRFRHNAPLPGGWRHIAYTYDQAARRLRIYVDGKINRDEALELAIQPADAICLGGVRTGKLADAPFNGVLGEVAISAAVLSEADIGRLAAGAPAAGGRRGEWIVRLDANGLAAGPLKSWPNAGTRGGRFEPEAEPAVGPRADRVDGRAAVTFDGQRSLRADITTPVLLMGNRPFTVKMWVLNPKGADVETVFSLARAVAMPSFLHESSTGAANFNFGTAKETGRDSRPGLFSSGQSSRDIGWGGVAPAAGNWQHVAYVYSGGYRGVFTVYVGGQVVRERGFFALDTIQGYPMYSGSGWNTARGAINPF